MRICFVSTASQWGGGERLLASLATGVRELGQEVSLATRRNTPMSRWARKAFGGDVLKISGRGRDPWSLLRLRNWIKRQQFDVVVLNDPHAITSGGIATAGLPVKKVGIRHTVFPIHSSWKHNRLLDHVVCVAQAAEHECHQAGIEPAKTSVIYAGLEKPTVDPTNVATLRAMFHKASGLKPDSHLLALGSLLPVKGFDTLIRAVAEGAKNGRRWRLWLAGEGQEREKLDSLASSLGIADRVHFLGFRKDIGDLLSAADVLVSASKFEGLSLVLIEAMQIGCPIVATPVGGNREALCVDQMGVSPFSVTFSPGDVPGLVSALEDGLQPTLNQPRAQAAQAWAEHTFSVRRMAESHLELYRGLVGCSQEAIGEDRSAKAA